MRTVKQNNALYGYISALGITPEDKMNLVRTYTNGRETSSAKMSFLEMDRLLQYMRKLQAETSPLHKMRSKAFALAHELGWEHPDGSVDVGQFNKWLLKFGHLHKPLAEYNEAGLAKLLSQMEHIIKKGEQQDAA